MDRLGSCKACLKDISEIVNDREMAITGKNLGKKALFFDSNDDMISEHEIFKLA